MKQFYPFILPLHIEGQLEGQRGVETQEYDETLKGTLVMRERERGVGSVMRNIESHRC